MDMPPSRPGLAVSLANALLAPREAFERLRDARGWGWAAFVLVVLVQAAALFVFFGPMSPEWIVEQQLLSAGELKPDEQAAASQQLAAVAPYSAVFGAVGGAIMLGLMVLLLALVWFLAERMARGPRHAYLAWTRFAAWTQLPLVLASLGLILLSLLAADPNQPLSAANFASLNAWVTRFPVGHTHYAWAEQLNLFVLWSAVLAMIGFRTWTGAGWARAALVGALPWLLVFGTWGLLA